ncbi:MAG: 2-amino-4-hydroxy-6-hydroxymethyldihydropteridine diphosphokinase [Paludibacteraceae bacterium]|nr:2-amino-4-hydroxy-6-hydroxymethyldihydropteridine diphosphokinase [Candidatus Physcocola equi]MCQ2233196.1 2-amino-4-hydroxy-6-hydroxymethyldihydropteridine diphosphokinase [Paludibacteraceae bacterium]
MERTSVYYYLISLGSNYQADVNIVAGEGMLAACFPGTKFSKVLKTKGIGLSYDCWYLNQMALVKTELNPTVLKNALKSIEKQCDRGRRYHAVTLDLDIVWVNGELVHKDFDKYPFLSELMEDFESFLRDF